MEIFNFKVICVLSLKFQHIGRILPNVSFHYILYVYFDSVSKIDFCVGNVHI